MLVQTRVDVPCPISDSTPYSVRRSKVLPSSPNSSQISSILSQNSLISMSIQCPGKFYLGYCMYSTRQIAYAGLPANLHSLAIFRSKFGYVKRRYTFKTLVLFLVFGPLKEIESVLPCFGMIDSNLVGGCRFGGYTHCASDAPRC